MGGRAVADLRDQEVARSAGRVEADLESLGGDLHVQRRAGGRIVADQVGHVAEGVAPLRSTTLVWVPSEMAMLPLSMPCPRCRSDKGVWKVTFGWRLTPARPAATTRRRPGFPGRWSGSTGQRRYRWTGLIVPRVFDVVALGAERLHLGVRAGEEIAVLELLVAGVDQLLDRLLDALRGGLLL